MLDIKKVIPNDEFKAVYVTEENAKEFIEYAFPNEYNLDTLRIDKNEIPYVYAVVDSKDGSTKNDFFILNRWYMERADVIDPDYGWSDEEYFEKHYKIVGDYTMDESCKSCIYFHKFKRYVGNGFEESGCCTYFIQDNIRRGILPSYDVWVQDADPNGFCECYQPRKSLR